MKSKPRMNAQNSTQYMIPHARSSSRRSADGAGSGHETTGSKPRVFPALLLLIAAGCFGGKQNPNQDEFFTSGSREADQRASQRMARSEQLSNSPQDADIVTSTDGQPFPLDEEKLTLFHRLGGESGIAAIVDDFISRVLADPRVNWQRTGLRRGLLRREPVTDWLPTPENRELLAEHMAQFLSLATGGPALYEGKDLKETHARMRITNPEFDAVIGDLKASLDRRKVPAREQKELLAIVESTRPQIVTER